MASTIVGVEEFDKPGPVTGQAVVVLSGGTLIASPESEVAVKIPSLLSLDLDAYAVEGSNSLLTEGRTDIVGSSISLYMT